MFLFHPTINKDGFLAKLSGKRAKKSAFTHHFFSYVANLISFLSPLQPMSKSYLQLQLSLSFIMIILISYAPLFTYDERTIKPRQQFNLLSLDFPLANPLWEPSYKMHVKYLEVFFLLYPSDKNVTYGIFSAFIFNAFWISDKKHIQLSPFFTPTTPNASGNNLSSTSKDVAKNKVPRYLLLRWIPPSPIIGK